MKKLFSALIALLLVLSVTACSSEPPAPQTTPENGSATGEPTTDELSKMLEFTKVTSTATTLEELRPYYTDDTPDSVLQELVDSHTQGIVAYTIDWNKPVDIQMKQIGSYEGYTLYRVVLSQQPQQPHTPAMSSTNFSLVKTENGRFVSNGEPSFQQSFWNAYKLCGSCSGVGTISTPCDACSDSKAAPATVPGDITIPIDGIDSQSADISSGYTARQFTIPEEKIHSDGETVPPDGVISLSPEVMEKFDIGDLEINAIDGTTSHNHDISLSIGCEACQYTGFVSKSCTECAGNGMTPQ